MDWPGRHRWDGWHGRGSAVTPTAKTTRRTASGKKRMCAQPVSQVFLGGGGGGGGGGGDSRK